MANRTSAYRVPGNFQLNNENQGLARMSTVILRPGTGFRVLAGIGVFFSVQLKHSVLGKFRIKQFTTYSIYLFIYLHFCLLVFYVFVYVFNCYLFYTQGHLFR